MVYYIFLKSLRSLEEFRKNLHLKIPPKSPTNFQSLSKFKNSIFTRKEIFFNFQTNRPSGRASSPGPERPGRPSQPTRPSSPPSSFLPQRAGSATASSRAAAPWAPRRPSPTPWSDRNERAPSLTRLCAFTRT
jgi:hypothetical protein